MLPLEASCNAVIVIHNHPSGDVTPSKEDIATTIRLKNVDKFLALNYLTTLLSVIEIY